MLAMRGRYHSQNIRPIDNDCPESKKVEKVKCDIDQSSKIDIKNHLFLP